MSKVQSSTINQPSNLPATTRFRKSPITLLKEECLELRKKTSEDELLIAEQAKEIERIKQLLQKDEKKENKIDDSNKSKLKMIQSKSRNELITINLISKKSLSEISPSGKTNSNLQDEIVRLEKQLDMQEYHYKTQIEGYKRLLEEKEHEIQKHQTQIDSIKAEHTNQISLLKAQHQEEYKKLEKQQLKHEEVQKLDKVKVEKNTNKKIHDEFERILYEFEQEEHSNRVVIPVKDDDNQHHSLDRTRPISVKLNQQWWTQKFVPTDAISWPSPQPLSNLRKVPSGKGLRM